jgi:hypothetical protein
MEQSIHQRAACQPLSDPMPGEPSLVVLANSIFEELKWALREHGETKANPQPRRCKPSE